MRISSFIKEASSEQKTELLESSSWAKEFSWEDINELAQFMDLYVCPPGTDMIVEGDSESFLAILTAGGARVVKKGGSGEEKKISAISRGKAFGEISLVDKQARSATVVAEQETSLLVISEGKFKLLCEHSPKVGVKLALKISKILAHRLRSTSGKLIDFLDE